MAISFVNSITDSAANGGKLVSITLPSIAVNDCLIISFTCGSSKSLTDPIMIINPSGSTATLLTSKITSSYCNSWVGRIFYTSTADTTLNIQSSNSGSSDSGAATILIFRGVSTSTPERTTPTSTTGFSAAPNSPAITSLATDDAVITMAGMQANVSLTAPSSWLNSVSVSTNDTNDAASASAWLFSGSTGIDPAAWSSTLSAAWSAVTVALMASTVAPAFTWSQSDSFFHDFRGIEMVGY